MSRRFLALSTSIVASLFLGSATQAESLRDAVRAAVGDSPAARVQDAEVKATTLELLSRERDFLPTLNVTGEVGAQYYNDPARLAPANNNRVSAQARAGIEARYVIFDGYRRANEVYRDAARVDASIFRLMDASDTLALGAVEAYVDVLRHRQLAALARQNIARHRDIGERVLDLVDGGGLPTSDRFEIEQRIAASRLVLVQVEQALADANARYEAAIGHAPGSTMSLPWLRSLPLTRDAFVLDATRNSFRVKAADAAVKQAEYGREITASGTLPQVVARTGANVGLNQNGVPGTGLDAYAAVGVEWEVFSGGRDAQKRAATMRMVQAMAERDMAVLEVRELANTTWNSYHANIERTVLLDRQLSATRRTADQYRSQFEAGTRGLIEVLDAERAWFNARFEDVSAEASYVFNQYQILAVSGKLAAHFDVSAANLVLAPDFERRAVEDGAYSIFSTDIPTLE